MATASQYWRFRFARWSRPRDVGPGYTLLVPVPGDLPVFLELALAVTRRQSYRHRRATLVIPDASSPAVRAIVEREARDWPGGGLRLVDLPLVDRLVLPRLGDPGRNHGAQIIAGVQASTTERVILHDADLFTMDDEFHDDLVDMAEARDLDVLGISPSWDPWYAQQARELAATWEQCTRTSWLRAFPPHRHIGHEAAVAGEAHVFDTTFWPQLHTAADRIGVAASFSDRVVHFNYVISAYRKYQRAHGTYEDRNYRLLLIRLMIDLFDDRGSYRVPSLEELARGLDPRDRAPVRYDTTELGRYNDFRARVDRLFDGPWVRPIRAQQARTALRPFDQAFEYAG